MSDGRPPGGEGPLQFECDGMRFGYRCVPRPGGGLSWVVAFEVDGRVVRAAGTTATEAWGRAYDLALRARRGDADPEVT